MADTIPTSHDIILPVETGADRPVVREITTDDLIDVLRKGIDDFLAMPTHVVFIGIFYAAIGLLLGRAALGYEFIPLIYPMVAGFALLGPVAAIGLYELSRRRELGRDTSLRHMFDFVHSPSLGAIGALTGVLLALFIVWIAIADSLYAASFGQKHLTSLFGFLGEVFTTTAGLKLMVLGNLIGLMFAILVLSLTVVAFPLLLDRHSSMGTAMATSLLVIARNPKVMAIWGLIVAAALFAGSLPFLLGLAIVFPVLGHATWHLYRAVVEPAHGARPDYRPPQKYKRYGAQFPFSLLAASSDKEDHN